MRFGGATFGWVSGLLALCLAGGLSAQDGTAAAGHGAAADSTGARIGMERDGNQLRVQGLFAGTDAAPDTLSYELTVRRSGTAGTSQTAQSGVFAPTPNQVDTLSTVQVSVQSGDQLRLRLTIRADGAPIDTARIDRTIS